MVHNAVMRTASHLRLVARLFEPGGAQVFEAEVGSLGKIDGGKIATLQCQQIKAPLKWSAETPHLYTLLLILQGSNRETLDIRQITIGFRQVEIKDGIFVVNGTAIKMQGVNRHEFYPDTGHAVPYDAMVQDIRLSYAISRALKKSWQYAMMEIRLPV